MLTSEQRSTKRERVNFDVSFFCFNLEIGQLDEFSIKFSKFVLVKKKSYGQVSQEIIFGSLQIDEAQFLVRRIGRRRK